MAAAAATSLFLPIPTPKPSLPAIKPLNPLSILRLSANPHTYPSLPSPLTQKSFLRFRPCSTAQDIAAEAAAEEEAAEGSEAEAEKKRKLYVVNLPWSYSAPDIEKLFGDCGTVKKVEIIKQKNGKSRGFAFVTMASGEEARAVIEKFNSFELLGRIIRAEFAKSFRKPSPPPPPPPPGETVMVVETRHTIYASNLAWKVRSVNLRDLFTAKYKPLSARVVFDNRKSAGYGFVSFATEEEAEAAVSELDGKELMGRPLRLRINKNKGDKAGSEPEEDSTEGQSEEI